MSVDRLADRLAAARCEPHPASPCLGICLMDPRTGLCRGCWRTIDEIAGWFEADPAEKRAILARLPARRPAALRGP